MYKKVMIANNKVYYFEGANPVFHGELVKANRDKKDSDPMEQFRLLTGKEYTQVNASQMN